MYGAAIVSVVSVIRVLVEVIGNFNNITWADMIKILVNAVYIGNSSDLVNERLIASTLSLHTTLFSSKEHTVDDRATSSFVCTLSDADYELTWKYQVISTRRELVLS